MTPPRVLVLGGGIAGLAAAWECHRRGVPTVVLEAQPRAGGLIRTDIAGPYVLDAGPDAFLVTKPGAIGLCRELDIDSQLIGMKTPRGAYVLRDDELHALPEGGAFGIATRLGPFLRSTLLSTGGKCRVAVEPLVPCRRGTTDESAGSFFRRRFGVEAASWIAQPLLGGIHAGDLDRLSASSVFPQLVDLERRGRSVLLGLRRHAARPSAGGAFRSFPSGMATLTGAMVAQLPPGTVRLGTLITTITRHGDRWRVRSADGSTHDADLVVVAVPAHVAAEVLPAVSPDVAASCGMIRYVSSAAALLVYRARDIARPLSGSGYVTGPARRPDPVMATSWLTGKWDGRAPHGFTVLRGFFGGDRDEGSASLPDDTLIALAHDSWARRFGIVGRPVLARTVRWVKGSPQHEVGHLARIREIDARLGALSGVAVAGSGFRAVGIPDVITDARSTARDLLDRWRAR